MPDTCLQRQSWRTRPWQDRKRAAPRIHWIGSSEPQSLQVTALKMNQLWLFFLSLRWGVFLVSFFSTLRCQRKDLIGLGWDLNPSLAPPRGWQTAPPKGHARGRGDALKNYGRAIAKKKRIKIWKGHEFCAGKSNISPLQALALPLGFITPALSTSQKSSSTGQCWMTGWASKRFLNNWNHSTKLAGWN